MNEQQLREWINRQQKKLPEHYIILEAYGGVGLFDDRKKLCLANMIVGGWNKIDEWIEKNEIG